jgi:hypothetical protein
MYFQVKRVNAHTRRGTGRINDNKNSAPTTARTYQSIEPPAVAADGVGRW